MRGETQEQVEIPKRSLEHTKQVTYLAGRGTVGTVLRKGERFGGLTEHLGPS